MIEKISGESKGITARLLIPGLFDPRDNLESFTEVVLHRALTVSKDVNVLFPSSHGYTRRE